jgi:hypothetical protein
MPQSRVDYWWKWIQENEKLYNLCKENVDNNVDSNIYNYLKRIIDYIYGYDTDSYSFGITYGIKVVPYGQNIFISSDSIVSESATKDLNYNIECVNNEYLSSPHGQPIITYGAFAINDRLYSTGESAIPIKIINPPNNLKNVIITATISFNINTFLNSNNNDKIADKIENSINVEFNNYNNIYICQNKENRIKSTDDYGIYIRNIYNSEFFKQPDTTTSIDLARIIFRINDTTDLNNHKYEYYIIDQREIYGYFGLKQIEALNIMYSINNYINFSDYNSIDYIKYIFSYMFNDMSGSDGEFSPDFITFWEDQGKEISETILELYDELGP